MALPTLVLLLAQGLSFAHAAGEAPAFFGEVTVLLVVSALIAYGCFRLGLVPIIGFLVAGVIIGPNALGLVQDAELIDAATELGVIFLLTVVAICLGTAYVTSLAGVSLSLGAFLAGLLARATLGSRRWARSCRCKSSSARRFLSRSACSWTSASW